MTDHHMSPEQWDRLKAEGSKPGGLGEMLQLTCNVSPRSNFLQARRVGQHGSGLEARAAIHLWHSPDRNVTVYFTAAEARQLAAHILNMADEIDGRTPLVFFPRAAGETADEDKPAATEEEPTATEVIEEHGWKSLFVGQRARVKEGFVHGATHFLNPGTKVVVKEIFDESDLGHGPFIPALVEDADGFIQQVDLADLEPLDEPEADQ